MLSPKTHVTTNLATLGILAAARGSGNNWTLLQGNFGSNKGILATRTKNGGRQLDSLQGDSGTSTRGFWQHQGNLGSAEFRHKGFCRQGFLSRGILSQGCQHVISAVTCNSSIRGSMTSLGELTSTVLNFTLRTNTI